MSTPPKDKTQALVDNLYELTRDGKIDWQLSFDDAGVETKLGKSIVQIAQEFDQESESEYVEIKLKNEKGEVVDKLYSGFLSDVAPVYAPEKKYWAIFDELFTMANRQARGADQTIDEILEELGQRKSTRV